MTDLLWQGWRGEGGFWVVQGGRALGHGLGMEGAGGEVSGRPPPPYPVRWGGVQQVEGVWSLKGKFNREIVN